MTTYDELTPDALFLLENFNELDIVQMCADRGANIDHLTAELAALREGEEPYEDEAIVPTPAQWMWRWNRATPADRLAVATMIRAMSDRIDRVEALARNWDEADPLLPGQALAELRNALSDNPEPIYYQHVRAGDRFIRVSGTRVPTSDELAAIAALLDANDQALGRAKSDETENGS